MKLQDYALIAEITGGVAIILSLVFVGYEMQRNTATHTQTATQAVVGEYIGNVRVLASDAELACIYVVGVQDYNGLSGAERVRLSSWFLTIFYQLQEMYLIHNQGAMEPDVWTGFDSLLREVIQLPGVRQWWEGRRHFLGTTFQAYVDSVAESASEFEPVTYDAPDCAWVSSD